MDPKQDEIKIMKPGKRRWIFYAIAGLWGGLVWIGLVLAFFFIYVKTKRRFVMRLKILSMIVKRKLTLLIVFILFAYGCSAAYQAVKRGDELLQMKNYYGASQEYLSALRLEHDNKDAKMKLCQISRQAYEQKLSIAENAEKTSDFESAMRQYSDLANFLDRVSSYNCLNFAAINARAKITEMKSSSSEKYYKEAESLFANEDYSNAISEI